jgi:CBS domain-containing protein
MRTPVPTIDADAPLAEAADRMWSEGLDRLVVIEHERGIGVLSVSDLVQVLIPAQAGRRTVGEVMSRALVVCRAETPVSAAARAMTERRSRALIVVDPNGRPLGVVTGFDLLPAVMGGAANAPVATRMHAPVTIGPDATLRQALDAMVAGGLHRLIVVDPAHPDGVPLGLLSTLDLVAALVAPGLA